MITFFNICFLSQNNKIPGASIKYKLMSCYDTYGHQVGLFNQHAPLWQGEDSQEDELC